MQRRAFEVTAVAATSTTSPLAKAAIMDALHGCNATAEGAMEGVSTVVAQAMLAAVTVSVAVAEASAACGCSRRVRGQLVH